jgi:glycosyltransferase involved in cell wall biosynthesis
MAVNPCPATMMNTPRTVVVSSASVLADGGMAAYAAHVAGWLAEQHGSAVTVARFAQAGVPLRAYARREEPRTLRAIPEVEVRIVAPRVGMVPALHTLSRTVDRRYLDWWTLTVSRRAFGRALARAIPDATDVVHYVGSAWELLGFAALRVARKRGLGFTVWPAIHPGRWGDGPLDACLLAAADIVFAQSAHEVGTLERLGVPAQRIRLAPLGPAVSSGGDSARFRGQHALGTAPVVLFVGRRDPYKGYDALLQAFSLAQRQVASARLVTIGSGSTQAPLPGVLDLGSVDDATKADALAACDVFCMPSSDEAFGLVYVEAWSYGKPVVVGPAPAARELVAHGQTGLHVSQEPGPIADALVRLMSDPALARRMGEAGRRVQLERYTWGAAWRVHAEGLTAAHQRAARERACLSREP